MQAQARLSVVRWFLLVLIVSGCAKARGVRVQFDPEQPHIGPFPTDYLTVADSRQKTGRRVAMPLPDCTVAPGDCAELRMINELDGFNVQARLTVRFSGAVNPETLRKGVHYLWLDPVWPRAHGMAPPGTLTPVNRVVWDAATNTAWAKPDDVLEQGRRYAIVVTEEVLDLAGDPVERDPGFQACLDRSIGGDYCDALARALGQTTGARVTGGSVFTTLSVTPWAESARNAQRSVSPDFRRGPTPTVALADLANWSIRRQVRVAAPEFEEADFPASPAALRGVGRIAFGSFRSPRFLAADQVIVQTPSGQPVAAPQETEEIFFHVWLPATPAPAGGYPVILAGHGLTDDRFGIPSAMALVYAQQGYAVFAFNAVGHGMGPRSALRLRRTDGTELFVPTPGRTVDLDGNGTYATAEGCVLLNSTSPIVIRDCVRQTALDWLQAVRTIRAGVDLDGDGRADLNPDSMAWYSQSLGSFYGSVFLALDPWVRTGILNVGGGSAVDASRTSPYLKLLATLYFLNRTPRLANRGFSFEEQYAYRYEPVVQLTVPGARELQEVFERLEWIEAVGAPVNFAPHWKTATLEGIPIKRVLLQIATGDGVVPNPANSLLIRAANLREMTSLYRHDLARAVVPELPADPHAHLAWVLDPLAAPVALAAYQQTLLFLRSGEEKVPDINGVVRPIFGRDLFETPPAFLPENR